MDTTELHCILPRAAVTLPTNRGALKLQANQSTSAAATLSVEEAPRLSVPLSHWLILGLLVILSFLELKAYRTHGAMPVIASRAWALMGIAYFAATGMLIVGSLLSDLRKRKFVFALLVIALGLMVFYRLGDIYHLQINYESAQQLASFLKDNIHKPDWGYTGNAFVGYPARQYIVVATPSLFFGHTVFALQFGYAILFYTGVLTFFLGVRHYFVIKQHGELWALLTVLCCFTFPYLIRYLYLMEQIILPISFVMHALGWFLLSFEELTAGRALILAWISGLLGTSYTPALAAWGLFQIFFLLLLLRAARHRRPAQIVLWISVWVYTLTFGLCSFLTRIDVRLVPNPVHSTGPLLTTLKAGSLLTALKTFFLGHPVEYMSPLLAIFVVIFFLLALTGRLGLIKWITAVWCLIVIYFSAASAGYAQDDPVYTLYRSILLIPIMMLACWDSYLDFFKKFKQWKHAGPILAVILCLAAAAGASRLYFVRLKSYGPTSKELFISFLLKRAESAGIRHRPANFICETNQVTFHPILGYGDYFFPLWQMSILTADNPKFAQPEQSQPLVIITDSEIAHKKFLPAGWTGTGEMTYLDSYRRRFPVRYGLYRYSPLTKSSTNIQQFPQGVSALPTPLGIASTTENATHTFQAGKGTGQGEFDYPTGIAVDPNGNLLVADSGNGRIEKFSSNGKFVTSIGSRGKGEGQLREPNGIAVDRAGNMYVADAGNHRVEKLAPDGKFVAEWKGPGPGFYGPRRVAVGSDGSVYVVDQGHSRIAKFSPDGHPVTTWGIKGKGDGQFDDPTSVAVDPTTNKVYVADPINQRIQVSDSNGKFLTKWSVPEWGQPMGFEDLAIDSKTGRLYASSSHVTAVLIFDLNGTRLGSLTPKAPDKLEGPSALALFDRKLYVLDMTGNRISVIDL